MGVPVTGYSLDIGKAHTDFAEAKLQRRLIEQRLNETEVDQLALVAMAGASAEAMKYDEVGIARQHEQLTSFCERCTALSALVKPL